MENRAIPEAGETRMVALVIPPNRQKDSQINVSLCDACCKVKSSRSLCTQCFRKKVKHAKQNVFCPYVVTCALSVNMKD